MAQVIATNKKAYRDYIILESVECGIELRGSEVKSARDNKVNLGDSFARVSQESEIILYNAHISPYSQASYLNVDAVRPRKLLLHKKQIIKLGDETGQKKLTLVPLRAYFNDRGFLKLELGLCKGKKLYDKREDIKRRETERQIQKVLKNRRG